MRRAIRAVRYQFNVALQHQFTNNLSAEVTYTGLRGNHLPNTLNLNQLGREYIDRAANDPTVCSLTSNVIIPQGQPGYTSSQRDTCYGAFLRQTVPNPSRGGGPRGRPVDAHGAARASARPVPAVHVGQPARATSARAATTRCSCARTSASARGGLVSAQLHVLQELRQRRDGDRLAGGGRRPGGRLPDQQSRAGNGAEQLRCPAPRSSSTTLSICRSAKATRFGTGATGFVGTLISGWTAERRHHAAGGLPARVHRDAEPDRVRLRIAARTSIRTATRRSTGRRSIG